MQTYTINCYQADHVGQTDLTNMEANFEALRSTFSGVGAPANAIAGKQWFDTTKKRLKIRNNANNAWLGVMTGTTSCKIWIYLNAAEDGWAIDSGVSDRVLGLKGGNVYTTGAATAGTWASSSHTLIAAETPSHTHGNSGSHTHSIQVEGAAGGIMDRIDTGSWTANSGRMNSTNGNMAATSTHEHTSVGGDTGHVHAADANVRTAAAVGTLQYMDI